MAFICLPVVPSKQRAVLCCITSRQVACPSFILGPTAKHIQQYTDISFQTHPVLYLYERLKSQTPSLSGLNIIFLPRVKVQLYPPCTLRNNTKKRPVLLWSMIILKCLGFRQKAITVGYYIWRCLISHYGAVALSYSCRENLLLGPCCEVEWAKISVSLYED